MSTVILQQQWKNLLSLVTLGAVFLLPACDKHPEQKETNSAIAVKIYRLDSTLFSNSEKNLIGTITFSESKYGLLVTPDLKTIEPGAHGFHIHNNPSCDAAEQDGQQVLGLAAGDHYDPQSHNKHSGPYTAEGHLGDLPVLQVDQNGVANTTTLSPRLKLSDLKGHSIMIHQGPDNYSDSPKAGGGGARKYCGVVE